MKLLNNNESGSNENDFSQDVILRGIGLKGKAITSLMPSAFPPVRGENETDEEYSRRVELDGEPESEAYNQFGGDVTESNIYAEELFKKSSKDFWKLISNGKAEGEENKELNEADMASERRQSL